MPWSQVTKQSQVTPGLIRCISAQVPRPGRARGGDERRPGGSGGDGGALPPVPRRRVPLGRPLRQEVHRIARKSARDGLLRVLPVDGLSGDRAESVKIFRSFGHSVLAQIKALCALFH